jgi:hypothetical protein
MVQGQPIFISAFHCVEQDSNWIRNPSFQNIVQYTLCLLTCFLTKKWKFGDTAFDIGPRIKKLLEHPFEEYSGAHGAKAM